jgi:hypothetical protein
VPQKLNPGCKVPLNTSTRKHHTTILTPSEFLEKKKKKVKNSKQKDNVKEAPKLLKDKK